MHKFFLALISLLAILLASIEPIYAQPLPADSEPINPDPAEIIEAQQRAELEKQLLCDKIKITEVTSSGNYLAFEFAEIKDSLGIPMSISPGQYTISNPNGQGSIPTGISSTQTTAQTGLFLIPVIGLSFEQFQSLTMPKTQVSNTIEIRFKPQIFKPQASSTIPQPIQCPEITQKIDVTQGGFNVFPPIKTPIAAKAQTQVQGAPPINPTTAKQAAPPGSDPDASVDCAKEPEKCTGGAGTKCNIGNGLPLKPNAPDVGPNVGIYTAIGCIPTEPKKLIEGLLKFLSLGAGGIAFIIMLLASLQMITAEGNPETIKGAKEKFYSAIIGLLLIIFSVLLMQVIGVDLLGLPELQSPGPP